MKKEMKAIFEKLEALEKEVARLKQKVAEQEEDIIYLARKTGKHDMILHRK